MCSSQQAHATDLPLVLESSWFSISLHIFVHHVPSAYATFGSPSYGFRCLHNNFVFMLFSGGGGVNGRRCLSSWASCAKSFHGGAPPGQNHCATYCALMPKHKHGWAHARFM